MQKIDLWDLVPGQIEATDFLKKAVLSPVHAYLFVGPEGAGREEIARAFAGSIFAKYEEGQDLERCKDLAWRGIHPDLLIIEPEGRGLRVSDARKIIIESSRSPIESEKKILIVNRFDTAEPEAVASLLKTIEEPSLSTIFVLLAESVPDSHVTISSRCVRVDVPAMTVEGLADLLKIEGVKTEDAILLAEASAGNLGRARLLQEDASFIIRQDAWRTLPDRLDGSGAAVSIAVEELQKMIDNAQSPLTDRHNQELEHLGQQEEVFGIRGSGRQEVVERHRREIRRLRDDELRFGLATLSRRYRDLGIAGNNSGVLDAVGVITSAAIELIRNPNERLLLQALFLNLSTTIEV
jgi:DNA polymerase-3 subunit delta'